MTDPAVTPTESVDSSLPAPEERPDVDAGAWQGERPDEPVDGPEPVE